MFENKMNLSQEFSGKILSQNHGGGSRFIINIIVIDNKTNNKTMPRRSSGRYAIHGIMTYRFVIIYSVGSIWFHVLFLFLSAFHVCDYIVLSYTPLPPEILPFQENHRPSSFSVGIAEYSDVYISTLIHHQFGSLSSIFVYLL